MQAPHGDVPHTMFLRSNRGTYRAGGKLVRVSMDTPGIPQLSRGERTYGLNVQIPLINVTLAS